MEFPVETAQSMFEFRPDDVVGNIGPRPILFLHAASDSVTPTYESIEMFRRAKPPVELHLFHGVDHFMLAEKQSACDGTAERLAQRKLFISFGVIKTGPPKLRECYD